MKIAMIGTRGVPANYGGFETCVEELGRRLAERGHEVTVYCRSSSYPERLPAYLGMELVYLPCFKGKAVETLSHTFLSVLHASFMRSFDVLMVFNAANSPALAVPRLLGKKIAINTDGLEWKRGKWGVVARRYYKSAEWLSTRLADRIVADSTGIQDYYRDTYGKESTYIAYGAYPGVSRDPKLIEPMGLKPGGYFLQVTRFEPENNPLLTIQAYKKLKTDKKLVLVGGVPYRSGYAEEMARLAKGDPNIIMPGYIFEKELLNELWCNSFAYVHGNEVGGTNPALLQSMGSASFVIAIDVPFSRDVLSGAGIFFDKDAASLAQKMNWAIENKDGLEPFRKRAVDRIREHYSWERVADGYEALFYGLAGPDAVADLNKA